MSIKFTDEQIKAIYLLMTGSDEEFCNQLARAAVQSAVEVHVDMCNDGERGLGNGKPDDNDIRQYAKDFTYDTMSEFQRAVNTQINEIQFKANIDIKMVTSSNLKFK